MAFYFKETLFNLPMYLGTERAHTAMLNPSAVIWVVSQIHLIVGFHLQQALNLTLVSWAKNNGPDFPFSEFLA